MTNTNTSEETNVEIVRCTRRELAKSQAFDYLVGFIESHKIIYYGQRISISVPHTLINNIFEQTETIKKGLPK